MIKMLAAAVAETTKTTKAIGTASLGGIAYDTFYWIDFHIVKIAMYAGFVYSVTMFLRELRRDYRESRASNAEYESMEIQRKRDLLALEKEQLELERLKTKGFED